MAFGFSRRITIDSSLVPSTLTNFPLLFAGTYTYLKTTANGGNVRNANGYDIAFFSDIDLTTPLDFELDEYSATTGAVAFWVRIPSLSSSVDTVIYIGYGDAGITTDQSDGPAVFPTGSGYRLVCHLPNGANKLLDSTSLGYDLTDVGSSTVAARIGSGVGLDGSADYLTTDGINLQIAGPITMSAWVYPTSLGQVGGIVHRAYNFMNYQMQMGAVGLLDGKLYGGANIRDYSPAISPLALTLNAWNFVQAGYNNSVNFVVLNGVRTLSANGASGYTGISSTQIGVVDGAGGPEYFWPGRLDEVRITTAVLSDDWIATEYANQLDPESFYTITDLSDADLVVTIDSVEADPLRWTFNIQAPINGIATMRADFDSYGSPIFLPDLDAEIVVSEYGQPIFGGYITALRLRGFEGPNGDSQVVETTSADYKIAATRRYVNETITSSGSPLTLTLKDILEVLVTYLTPYGITLDPSQVDGPDMDPVVYEERLLKDILDELAVLTGYVWDVDVDKAFSMYAIGSRTAPYDLDEAADPVRYFGDIVVEPTRDQYANRVRLQYGPNGNAETTDYFFADGIEDTFQLSAPLVGPNYTDNSVGYGFVTTDMTQSPDLNETIALLGGPPADWEYDPTDWTIRYVSGAVPNGYVIRITYTGQFPQTITVEDAGEISAHGLFEAVVQKTLTQDRVIATSMAAAELVKHTTVLRRVTYASRERGFEPGQTLALSSPKRDLDTEGVIVEVVTEFQPGDSDAIRRLTVLEGVVPQGDWREIYRRWIGAF